MKIQKLLVMIILIQQWVQTCERGCLKCSSGSCTICDIMNKFYLKDSACVQSPIIQCYLLTMDGLCLMCETDLYLKITATSSSCTKVEAENKINFCQFYDSDQKCLKCLPQFYLEGNICKLSFTKVPNCYEYSNDGICKSCQKGYHFSEDKEECLLSNTQDNCMNYTYIQCKQCANGFKMNNGLYSKYLFDPTTISTTLLKMLTNIKNYTNTDYQNYYQYCEAVTIENCLKYDGTSCEECKSGYKLYSGKCYQIPVQAISNCLIYNYFDSCLKCDVGYYMPNTYTCKKIADDKKVTDCSTYENNAQTVKCERCIDTKYLSAENTCTARTNTTIANCSVYHATEDKCLTCNTGYLLSSNGLKCVQKITNCLTQNINGSDLMTCTKCQDYYYITQVAEKSDVCTAISAIANCIQATKSGDTLTCSACAAGYKDSGQNTCVSHDKIANCAQYDTSGSQISCTKCSPNFFAMDLIKLCKASTDTAIKDKKCKTFDASNACVTCFDGYYLNDSSVCIQINPVVDGCIQYDTSGHCQYCNDKKIVDITNNKCLDPYKHFVKNCSSLKYFHQDALSTAFCYKCDIFTEPISLKNTTVCAYKDDKYITTLVDNCNRYDSTGNSQKCIECNTGYFLSVDNTNTCISTCTFTGGKTILLNNLSSSIANECASTSSNIDSNTQLCQISFQAHDGNSVIQSCLLLTDAAKTANNKFYIEDLVFGFNKFSMAFETFSTAPSDGNYFKQLLYQGPLQKIAVITAITNCVQYFKINIEYKCIACTFGTHFLKRTYSANNVTDTCVAFTNDTQYCDVTKKYTGLPSFLNVTLGCHFCKDPQKYIYIKITANDNLTANDFNILYLQEPQNIDGSILEPVSCEKPAEENNVKNCLAYAQIKNSNINTPFCVSCMPGYKPTYHRNNSLIFKCDPVENCDLQKEQTISNSCQTCRTTNNGGSVQYFAFQDYTQRSCKQTLSDNCYITGSDLKCLVCYNGYIVNNVGHCIKLEIPYCQDGQSGSQFNYSNIPDSVTSDEIAKYRIHYALNRNMSVYGCSKCDTNYIRVKETKQVLVCLPSTYLKTDYTHYQQTPLIQNCAQYEIVDSTTFKCTQCREGYIYNTSNQDSCKPKLPFCLETAANSQYDCTFCQTNFKNTVFGTFHCVYSALENCSIIKTSANPIVCQFCNDGYYLDANKKCQKGKVLNCIDYTDEKEYKCVLCAQDYVVYTIDTDYTYCLPIFKLSELQYCTQVNNASLVTNTNDFTCGSCSQDTTTARTLITLSTDTTNYKTTSICIPYSTILNCDVYYQYNDATLDSNDEKKFQCQTCKEKYFLSSDYQKCSAVTIVLNCKTYSPIRDVCTECNANYYYDDVLNTCEAYPTGIDNCYIYSSAATCTQCKDNYYLSDNKCIHSDVLVNSCATYSAEKTCSQCHMNYFLSESKCARSEAQNCKAISSSKACSECYKQSPILIQSNDITSCQQIAQDKQYCLTMQPNAQQCQSCRSGFFLQNGDCISTDVIIPNCLYYASVSQCQQCDIGYYLATDKKECLDVYLNTKIDTHCSKFEQLADGICQICKPGYYISSAGICSACTDKAIPKYGCQYCSQSAPSTCEICMSKYHQMTNGTCVLDCPFGECLVKTVTTTTSLQNGIKESNLSKSDSLYNFIFVFFAILLVFQSK